MKLIIIGAAELTGKLPHFLRQIQFFQPFESIVVTVDEILVRMLRGRVYLFKNFSLPVYYVRDLLYTAENLSHKVRFRAGKQRVVGRNVYSVFPDYVFLYIAAQAACRSFFAQKGINPLAIRKDSVSYTFRVSMNNSVKRYFEGVVKNPKEKARFDKQNAKREALIAKGRSVDYKVMPMMLIDLDQERLNVENTVRRLREKYENDIAAEEPDFDALAVALVDDFKEKASQVVSVVTKKMAREKAIKLMEEVGIPEPRVRFYQYPFEFSGGMRQRIVIAIALAANPDILICDEPTTALDVTIQAQILELINKLKRERNLSVIFITHDLGVVANMADRIAVMYAGKIVEYGTCEDVFYDPRHPYTWALLSSMPDLDTKEKLEAIPGTPPNMIYPPQGDAFAARNKYAMKIDFEKQPPMFKINDTHYAATWLLHPDAPKVDPPKLVTDRISRMKREVENNGRK